MTSELKYMEQKPQKLHLNVTIQMKELINITFASCKSKVINTKKYITSWYSTVFTIL